MTGRILEAITRAPLAWTDAAELAAELFADPAAILDGLEALEAEGLAARWPRPGRVLWTLTPLAADRLAVELVEFGLAELPRWQPLREDPPRLVEPSHAQDPFRYRPDILRLAGLNERPAPTPPEPPPCPPTPPPRGPSKTLVALWGFPLW